MRWILPFFAATALFVACSDDASSPPTQADAGRDAAEEDAGENPDAKDANVADASGGDGCTTCSFQVDIEIGGMKRSFDQMKFGFDSPDVMRLEVQGGGTLGCPEETSPTPDRSLIVAGVGVGKTTTEADGAKATLLEFKGDLTKDPATKATKVTVAPKVDCCVAKDQIAYSIDASSATMKVTGLMVGEHCTSLD